MSTISEFEAGKGLDAIRQGTDRYFLIRADIEHLTHRVGMVHQCHQGADNITDMAKAARLGAIAVNGDRAGR